MQETSIENLYQILQEQMERSSSITQTSARHLLRHLVPEAVCSQSNFSVVDFGCGRRDWLKAAKLLGAGHLLGLETHGYKNSSPEGFNIQFVDLERPVILDRKFHLAICVEVAEHLNAAAAESLVKSLCTNAHCILFSAAIPGQGGIHHINEQPPAYWQRLFAVYGKICVDKRQLFWEDSEIAPWYRQNAFAFVDDHVLSKRERTFVVAQPAHLVHPEIFSMYAPKDEHVIFHYESNGFRADRIAFDDGNR
jgi:hypothetical protein